MNAKQRRTAKRGPYRTGFLSMRREWTAMPAEHKHEIVAECARIRAAIKRDVLSLLAAHQGKVPMTLQGVEQIESTLRRVLEREVPPFVPRVTITEVNNATRELFVTIEQPPQIWWTITGTVSV